MDRQLMIEHGKRLRIIRIVSGLSQEQMSELMDISVRQYQRYESGLSSIMPMKLKIADISADYVYTGIDYLDKCFDRAMQILDKEAFDVAQNTIDVFLSGNPDKNINEFVIFLEFYKKVANYYLEHLDALKKREYEGIHLITNLIDIEYKKRIGNMQL